MEETNSNFQTPTPTQEPQKNNNFLVVLLSILLLLACLIAGFFAYQTQNLVKELGMKNEELKKAQKTPAPSTTPDPTTNWKTYTDLKLNLSFRIDDLSFVVNNFTEFQSLSKKSSPAILVTNSSIYNSMIKKCDPKLTITENCFVGSKSWGQIDNVLETTLGGKPAISYYLNDPRINEPIHITELTSVPNIQIAQVVGGSGLDERYKQIISTLKFIEPTTNTSPLPVACTAEAKICPDGSSVGRTGPKCEFKTCPTTTSPQP